MRKPADLKMEEMVMGKAKIGLKRYIDWFKQTGQVKTTKRVGLVSKKKRGKA